MRKRIMLGAVALATVGLISAFATTAYATPGKTTACTGCHSGTALAVTATQTSNNGTTASYSVKATGASYIAVFKGSSKIAQVTGASGTISVADGSTYTLYAVKGPTTSSGVGSKSISPVAPAPVPVPDPTPVPTVTPTPDPTPVPTPDPTVTPTPDPTPTPTVTVGVNTLRIHVMAINGHGVRRASVTIVDAAGARTTLRADKHGWVSFKKLAAGRYTVTVTLSNGHKLTRTLTITHRTTTIQLKDHKKTHKSESHSERD